MPAPLSSPVLDAFGTSLGQHARLLTLTGPYASLAVERIAGHEAVNDLYRFDVDALSPSTDLDLSTFIGEELTVSLLQPDGSRRAWHGLCTSAAWLGADGGAARYRLRLEPALSLLALRRDSWIFQDRSARDIVTELLQDYPQVRFDFDLGGDGAVRPISTQYRESDLAFLTRLLASEGWSWRFEHDQDGGASADGQAQARHRLVIFDARARLPPLAGGAALRFHGVRATEAYDSIDAFGARRRVGANGVAVASWEPAQLLALGTELASTLEAGALPPLQVYEGSGERRFGARADADRQGRAMLQALELDNKVFEGAGAVRRLAAGHAFKLTQHARYPDGENAFAVLWVHHEARNNLHAGQGARAADEAIYRNTFGCVRDTVAIVPSAAVSLRAPTAPGPQTALVVGLPDATATTTRDHQVRIQFPWQRGAAPNPGGMAHQADGQGNAPGDERSGTWVRLAEALAGPDWGTQFTPRIGTEVLVDFIEGDIDRPVVVAQLYNGTDTPPFAAGVDAGVEHAGTLSGIQTRSVDGGGWNQWQLDDTSGQLRTRLATSSGASQLNLGYLVQQQPGSAQRGALRGSGFELRTDAWAVIRAAGGVLLSTSACPSTGSGVASTQMDASEALGRFEGARSLADTLAAAATQQQALSSQDAARAQAGFIAQLDPRQQGRHTGSIGGQQALKASHGTRELDAAQPVEKFGSSLLLMDAAATINWATPASTVVHAGRHLHWTTQSDLHLAAAHTLSTVAGNAAGLFAHDGGIQAIAANGPVSLQAHTDRLEIVADGAVTVVSVNDGIEIEAKEKIVLKAGQAAVTLDGGDITFACPGTFSVKGGKHVFDGGAGKAAELARLPDSGMKHFDEAFILRDKTTGQPLSEVEYRVRHADGSFAYGRTDESGQTHLINTGAEEQISIEVKS
nr:type VI secretion system Vgr family protein [uncultured Massilia sp.]